MTAGFFELQVPKPGLVAGAAGLMVVAGLTHLIVVPIHWAHAPIHGAFFVLMGLVQIAWGLAFWRRPSLALYRLGVILAGGLITLWLITRFLPAPFEHEPGAIDLSGIICKVAEALGIAILVAIVVTGTPSPEMRRSAWRMAAILGLAAFLIGWAAYGLGLVLEPVLPGLGATGTYHEEQSEHDHGATEPHEQSGQEHKHDE
jgi:hypothetical protein